MSDQPDRTWKCPYLQRNYVGCCPVKTCSANIKPTRHASGCLHNCFPNKEIGIYELAYAFGRDASYIKERNDEGVASLRKIALFQRYLEWARLRAPRHTFCSKCGSVLTEKSKCPQHCKRSKTVARLLDRYPFNVDELDVTKNDLGLLVFYRTELEKLFKDSFQEVTRLSDKHLDKLTTKSTNGKKDG